MKLMLCFDGLDYHLVDQWCCENLKQYQYCEFEVPSMSPEDLWRSILSGNVLKDLRPFVKCNSCGQVPQ